MSKIKIPNARLSYPSLFKKAKYKGDETKYECTLILDKVEHAEQIKQLKAAAVATLKEKNNGKNLKDDKKCLRDGDVYENEAGEKIPEYQGCYVLKVASNKRPVVLDKDKSPLSEEDGVIYAGCYVNAIVSFWFQDNDWGKRLNGNIHGVQFRKDGEAFGEAPISEDEFDDFGDMDEFTDDDGFDDDDDDIPF